MQAFKPLNDRATRRNELSKLIDTPAECFYYLFMALRSINLVLEDLLLTAGCEDTVKGVACSLRDLLSRSLEGLGVSLKGRLRPELLWPR